MRLSGHSCFLLLAALLLGPVPQSCGTWTFDLGDDDLPDYEVKTDLKQDTTIVFEALENSFTFTIEAEGDWKIEIEEVSDVSTRVNSYPGGWVSVNPVNGGKGKFKIEVGLTPNLSLVERYAHLKLRHQRDVQIWPIEQKPSCYETDGVVTIALMTPGTLKNKIDNFFSSRDKVKKLRILGKMNDQDVSLFYYMPNLTYLDLRQVSSQSIYLSQLRSLQYLYLPDTMTEIANNAFSSNRELIYVQGSAVQKIGFNAFLGCSKLEECYFPEVELLDSRVFSGCESLKRLVFPKLTTVGGQAFAGCTSLSEISFDSLEELDQQLSGWNGPCNLRYVYLPKLRTIGSNGFAYQTQLDTLVLPSLEECGRNLLHESSVSELYCNAMTVVPEYAFASSPNLRTAAFENAKQVNPYAFSFSERLKNVFVPRAETLESHAFYGCTLGGNLDFSSVQFIGASCFEDSQGIGSHVVKFPLATYIGPGAFRNCESLTTIEIPVVIYIEAAAFYGCTTLWSISEENRLPFLSKLGNDAFSRCLIIQELDFPILNDLGVGCFDGCKSLMALKFGGLNWRKMTYPDQLWPDSPFEFWTFPIDRESEHILLFLGVDPGRPDSNNPWWSWSSSDDKYLFMNRKWAAVCNYEGIVRN